MMTTSTNELPAPREGYGQAKLAALTIQAGCSGGAYLWQDGKCLAYLTDNEIDIIREVSRIRPAEDAAIVNEAAITAGF